MAKMAKIPSEKEIQMTNEHKKKKESETRDH